jgi:hypothetical protein
MEYYYSNSNINLPSKPGQFWGNDYYKLNDWIYHQWGNGKEAIQKWPKSIAGQYNKLKGHTKRTKLSEKYLDMSVGEVQQDILSNCVNNVIKDFSHLFCKEKNCCIHLRLGDAMHPHFWSATNNFSYAPFKENVVYQAVKNSVPVDYTINIIYSSSAGGTSEVNPEVLKSSEQYVEHLVKLLKKHYQNINCWNNSHPDIDFCRAIHSDIFVCGVGGFTNLILSHREYRKLTNIKTFGVTYDPNIGER